MPCQSKLCGRSQKHKRMEIGRINRFIIEYSCESKRPILSVMIHCKPTNTCRISSQMCQAKDSELFPKLTPTDTIPANNHWGEITHE